MLQKIKGFAQTQEARNFLRLIEERQAGAALFSPAAVVPVAKQTPKTPRI